MIPMRGEAIRSRIQGLWNGTMAVTVVVDASGSPVADVVISTTGFLEPYEEDEVLDQVAEDIYETIDKLSRRDRGDNRALSEAIRLTARRSVRRMLDKKPIVDVHLVRV
jgi:ribonuclease J